MNAPQIIWIMLATAGLTIELVRDGKPKTGTHRFFPQLIGTALAAGLLYWGGFFG